MEAFELKSTESSKTADELIQNQQSYDSSVHCSYYSCVQFMLHILCTISGVYNLRTNQEREHQLWKELGEWDEKGFHVKLERKIFTELPHTTTQKIKFDLRSFIKDLKNKRVAADYSEVKTERDESKRALTVSRKINQTLRNEFRI